jgi:hypothetical protein
MAEKAVKNRGEKVGRWVKKPQKRQKEREEGRASLPWRFTQEKYQGVG